MSHTTHQPIENAADLHDAVARLRKAQLLFATYSQEQADAVFRAAATAANHARIPLAEMAVSETGMGIVEDKVIKNHFASEYIYNAYKNEKTCGVIEHDPVSGITRIAEPIGVITAVIPTTNPTSTAIFKCLLALKTRNAILLSPHPRAKSCTIAAASLVLEAAVRAGAPAGIIDWIDTPSLTLSDAAMKEADMILATGGPALVKAAYTSGKPAIGVGAGNTPAIITQSADITLAVNAIMHSKTFDNGVVCASEQAVIAMSEVYDAVKAEFIRRGAYFPNADELDRLRAALIRDGILNADIVGKRAVDIAAMAGFNVPPDTKLLIGETDSTDLTEALAHEKLSPVLAMYRADNFDEALDKADTLVKDGGFGHTSAIYLDPLREPQELAAFQDRMKTCRILINTPASQGGVGDLYNFRLTPSLTLGCGSWGGNSVCENVGIKHLLNIKTVADRRHNMLWFRVPQNIYLGRGCLSTALRDLQTALHKQRVFVVTDAYLFRNGHIRTVLDALTSMGIAYTVYDAVEPDPTLACAVNGAKAMRSFEPDCILAVGGGSAMDAAKVMWVLYEHPDADFQQMAMRFMDIRKRVYHFPVLGNKACLVAVPTTAGTGSEVTPFAVITDDNTHVKYPLADYQLMPHTAVVDADLMMHQPPALTATSGIDALTHALEAYASMMATSYTDALAKEAIRQIFEYLPRAYEHGAHDPIAREKMADAATMAGMAFANAFLGVCHSMAHKLGAFHHLPHGVANALLIEHVMRFNASEAPAKMGSFPQYTHPHTLSRYAALADCLSLGGNTDEEKFDALLDTVHTLKSRIGIADSIAAYGVDEQAFLATLDEMVREAFDDQCTGANPRYPLMSEIRQMYLDAYYG